MFDQKRKNRYREAIADSQSPNGPTTLRPETEAIRSGQSPEEDYYDELSPKSLEEAKETEMFMN